MRLLFTFLLASLYLFSNAQDWNQLRDEYLQTYDPEGYVALKKGEAVKERGMSLVNGLYQNLEQVRGLSNTFDPDQLLREFNQQIQQIEKMQANFDSQNNSYDFNTGQSIGNSINSGDYMGGLSELGGWLGNQSERKKAKAQMEAKKRALYQQRHSQMSKIYHKAQAYNEKTKKEYLKAAAYAESVEDENYNLKFVENLNCFSASMKNSFSSSNSAWLTNRCPKPQKSSIPAIENKFVAKDVQYRNIAARKMQILKETGYPELREGAIAFAAAAAKTNPNAENFYTLGKYYSDQSTVLAMSNYLTAQAYDPNFFTGQKAMEYSKVKASAENEIKIAIEQNNTGFIQMILAYGIDKVVRVNNKSLVNYAVKLDKPDAVQTILNKYVEGKSQSEVDNTLQKTIMLSAVNNSVETLKRFQSLGVPLNFSLKGYSPMQIAKKVNANEAYLYLAEVNNAGSDVQEAKTRIYAKDNAAFEEAQASNTISSYTKYKTYFPQGLHLSEADIAINTITKNTAYTQAKQSKSAAVVNSFIQRYPNSTESLELAKMLPEIYYSEGIANKNAGNSTAANTSFNNYIKLSPSGTYSEEVKGYIEAYKMENINAVNWTWSIDNAKALGISMDMLFSNSMGIYFSMRFNPIALVSSHEDKILDPLEYDGEIYKEDPSNNIDEWNEWDEWGMPATPDFGPTEDVFAIGTGNNLDNRYIFAFSGGIPFKVAQRVWLFGGVGIGFYEYYDEFNEYRYGQESKIYIADTEKQKWSVFPEIGAHYKVKSNLTLRYAAYLKHSKITHQIGVSFTKPW